jgi:purine-binding chemotaxis protein CheW
MMMTPNLDDLDGSDFQGHILTFELDRHTYALPLETIAQIIPMVTIISISQLNPLVQGIINVRGSLVPILDLQQHLKLPKTDLHLHTPILLIKHQTHTLGLIVKNVIDIISIPETDIVRPEDILPQELGRTTLIQGLIITNGDPIIVLDIQNLFSAQQVELLEQATTLLAEMEAPEEEASKEEAPAETETTPAGEADPSEVVEPVETPEVEEGISE